MITIGSSELTFLYYWAIFTFGIGTGLGVFIYATTHLFEKYPLSLKDSLIGSWLLIGVVSFFAILWGMAT